jgi:hypothetical protein
LEFTAVPRTAGLKKVREARRENKRRIRYATIPIVPVRSCHVSFLDHEGVRHAVEVQGESLYEAAVVALSRFRQHDCSPGVGSHLEIEIRSSVVHAITVGKIQSWLEGGDRSPSEAATKQRLKQLLAG